VRNFLPGSELFLKGFVEGGAPMSDGPPFEDRDNLQSGDGPAHAAEDEQKDADVADLRAQLKKLREDLNSCVAALKSVAKNRSLALGDNARELIDENPVPALLGTFAVGLVIGLVLQRPVRYYPSPPLYRPPR
jgi:ElaB/YqjD/DUF883 family membrane-anchored ribosome-binding protein